MSGSVISSARQSSVATVLIASVNFISSVLPGAIRTPLDSRSPDDIVFTVSGQSGGVRSRGEVAHDVD